MISMESEEPPSRLKISLSLIITLISGSILLWIDQFLKTPISQLGIVSFELAKTVESAEAIMFAWGIQGKFWAGWSLLLDFPFLVAYTTLFAALARSSKSDLKYLFTIGFLMAGMCDAVENLALIALLNGLIAPQLTAAAYYFASLKFMLLVAGWCFLLLQGLFYLWEKYHQTAHPRSSPHRSG